MELTTGEINLVRQWFNAVQDLNPKCLGEADNELYLKILTANGYPISCSGCVFMTKSGRCYDGYGYEGELMIVGSDFCCGSHRTQEEKDQEE